MSRSHSIRLIPAAGYLRRSDEKQEASIKDQRSAILSYAADHGYQILRWYVDDGISGDDTENREAFKQMRDDAGEAQWEAILCWNQDRFGRFDQLEAGFWIHPLRKAGKYLVTCDMGRIDWESPEGQLIYGVNQMGKHKFLKDLSRNVLRGQLEAAKGGSWIGSRPYAYRIVGSSKNKRLVLGDPAEVTIVRRIFREYVVEGRSLNDIAKRLQAEGVVCPGGPSHIWRFDSVKTILSNPAYCGDYVAYRYSYGKYHQVHDKQIVKGGQRRRNSEEDWIVHRDHHESIIDRDTFDKAQALIAKGKTGRSKYTPEQNPYVFSGLLRCGKCGSTLNGMRNNYKHQYYECRATRYRGSDYCDGSTVREDKLLRELGEFLMEWLELDGDALDSLATAAYYGAWDERQELPPAFNKVKKLIVPPTRPKKVRQQLDSELKQLTAELEKCRRNLIHLDPDNIPAAQAEIKQMDVRRQEVERDLLRSKPPAEADVNSMVLSTLHSLYSLAAACRELGRIDEPGWTTVSSLKEAAPQAIRRFFGPNYYIRIHTERSGKGSGIRHQFIKGELVFQPMGGGKEVGVNTRESNLSLIYPPFSPPTLVLPFGRGLRSCG